MVNDGKEGKHVDISMTVPGHSNETFLKIFWAELIDDIKENNQHLEKMHYYKRLSIGLVVLAPYLSVILYKRHTRFISSKDSFVEKLKPRLKALGLCLLFPLIPAYIASEYSIESQSSLYKQYLQEEYLQDGKQLEEYIEFKKEYLNKI
jgi:hypothetical protein